jgi:HTH-type transcriptional regulator / antitoxin MqsA
MSPSRTCPICGGTSQHVVEAREVKIGRWKATVDDEFFRCQSCGERAYSPGQMRATQERAAAVIREREKILSPERVRAFREKYGLTQSQLERLLNIGPKTVVRWERGTVMPSKGTSTLLKILEDNPVAVARLAVDNGVILGASLPPGTVVVQVYPAPVQTFGRRSPPSMVQTHPIQQPGVELPAAIASRLRGPSIEICETEFQENLA